MTQQQVYKIPVKHDEDIHFNLKEFRGNWYFDLRVYFQSKQDGSILPSKKGLTLNAGLLKEFQQGLSKLEEALEAEAVSKEIKS